MISRFIEWFVKPFVKPFFGGGGKGGDGGGSSIDPRITEMAQKSTFKPFTITTSAGSGFGREGAFGATASDQFGRVQQGALAGAAGLVPQYSQLLGQAPSEFQFNTNVDQLTSDYFNQQRGLLEPAFAQQRSNLQSDLFGSGRLGLQLAGQSVGAGDVGMVQPDAFGLARAQSQTLGELGAQSRQMALQDAQSRFGLEQGVFNTNLGARNQYLQQLGQGTQGLFGLGTGVSELELALLQQGMLGEQMRGASYSDAARALASGQVQEQDSGGKGLLGSAIGAAGNIGAAAITGGASAAAGAAAAQAAR